MNKKLYNNKIKAIGETMSVESKINVVGSAGIKRSLYYSDYDLFENVDNKSDRTIYNHFRSLFEIIKGSNYIVITDFKCGIDEDGEPLRWDYSDVMNNNNNGYTLEEAMTHKGMIKLDLVAFLNSRFIEISEVYNITLNKKSNMNYSKSEVLKELNSEYIDLVKDDNYMKALKRMFSIIKLNNPKDKKLDILINYFNSPIGLLYRCKADLETIAIILYYNKFSLDQVRDSLQMLKEVVSSFDVENNIEAISKLKSKLEMKKSLLKQIKKIKDFVNRDAKRFILSSGL